MRHGDIYKSVVELACAAGRAIMQVYESGDAEVSLKGDDSPLTKADLASHEVICRGLNALQPHCRIVSEEGITALDRADEGEFWLIDPLDGTKEFIARNGEFTVNIALIRDGSPVWGVVCAPALDQVYWGDIETGAYRRMAGQTCRIQVRRDASETCRVVASKSHLNEATSAFIKTLGKVELVQAGSSLKFCRVAEGEADVYPRLAPTCEWDTAAAHAIVEAAGGSVLDTDGAPLRYGKDDILNPHFIASARPVASMVKA